MTSKAVHLSNRFEFYRGVTKRMTVRNRFDINSRNLEVDLSRNVNLEGGFKVS